MSTIRRGPMAADRFTTVSDAFARDSRLTLKARGLGLWLFSHRDGWQLSIRSIAKQVGCGVDQVQSALKELEEHGYLTRQQEKQAGRFGDMEYVVSDVPAGDDAYRKPVRDGDQQDTEDPPEGSTADRETRTHKGTTPKETIPQGHQPQADISATGALFDLEQEQPDENGEFEDVAPGPSFADFWAEYPLRKAKQAALKAWDRALLRVPKAERPQRAADILEGAKRYAKERADQPAQFTKHPATWLNGGCWEDEAAPVGSGNPRGGYQPYRDQDYYPDADPYFVPERDLQD